MNSLRKNFILSLVLATLFVAQLFVPAAMAKSQASSGAKGIIICTNAGLKLLTSDGTLQSIGNDQSDAQHQDDCFVCLTGGCTFATNSTAGSDPVRMLRKKTNALSVVLGLMFDRYDATGNIQVRAPPSS